MEHLPIVGKLKSTLNITIVKTYPKSGQKQVFLVKNNKTSENVILKIIFHSNFSPRIIREIEIQQKYNFKYTPKILDYGNYDNNIYILEEFIHGKNLREIIIEDANFTAKELVEFAEKILDILKEFEDKDLVHRDLKPENIICNGEDWYVIDFGIAKANRLDSLTMINTGGVGPHTPGYGAPELFKYDSRIINIRADIFSLGIIMYELSTGYNPFISNSASDPNYEILYIKPELAEIQGDLENKPLARLVNIFMNTDISKRPRDVSTAKFWLHKIKTKLEEE